MKAIFGYYKWHQDQGQVRMCYNETGKEGTPIVQLGSNVQIENILSAIPVFNIFSGIIKIGDAIMGNWSDEGYHVLYDDFADSRKYAIISGIAELTLVGGWLLHGGATLYYYATRPEPQYDPV